MLNNKDFRVYLTYGGQRNDCGHTELLKNFLGRISYVEWVDLADYDKLNLPELTWREKKSDFVEEFIKGHKVESKFPLDMEGFDLIHVKSFDKQVKQNEFYSQINQK